MFRRHLRLPVLVWLGTARFRVCVQCRCRCNDDFPAITTSSACATETEYLICLASRVNDSCSPGRSTGDSLSDRGGGETLVVGPVPRGVHQAGRHRTGEAGGCLLCVYFHCGADPAPSIRTMHLTTARRFRTGFNALTLCLLR